MREANVIRETKETAIRLELNLDGTGLSKIHTGIGFFDHMLTLLARHGSLDLRIEAQGDLQVDAHHTVEDVGICLGKATRDAVGEPKGLTRYGHAVVPMDETLAEVAIDFSGRPFLIFNAAIPKGKVGDFDVELAEEFFRAFAMNSHCALHVNLRYGSNLHHMIEGCFKAFARALRMALEHDPRMTGIPSTKGLLEK